ncbi:MAG: hypothetical protein ACE5HC_10635 [Candidatus Binatia bacterium]
MRLKRRFIASGGKINASFAVEQTRGQDFTVLPVGLTLLPVIG